MSTRVLDVMNDTVGHELTWDEVVTATESADMTLNRMSKYLAMDRSKLTVETAMTLCEAFGADFEQFALCWTGA